MVDVPLDIMLAIPILLGLIGIAIAVFERGYKRFLEKKESNPTLKFDSSYMINILISSGGMTAIIGGVFPLLIQELGDPSNALPITIVSIIGNLSIGYLATYRILDGLNNATEQKIELSKLKAEVKSSSPINTTLTPSVGSTTETKPVEKPKWDS